MSGYVATENFHKGGRGRFGGGVTSRKSSSRGKSLGVPGQVQGEVNKQTKR